MLIERSPQDGNKWNGIAIFDTDPGSNPVVMAASPSLDPKDCYGLVVRDSVRVKRPDGESVPLSNRIGHELDVAGIQCDQFKINLDEYRDPRPSTGTDSPLSGVERAAILDLAELIRHVADAMSGYDSGKELFLFHRWELDEVLDVLAVGQRKGEGLNFVMSPYYSIFEQSAFIDQHFSSKIREAVDRGVI